MSKDNNLPGNDSIRPGQLDPGPLTNEHIRGAVARLEKLNQIPPSYPMTYNMGPVWTTARVFETSHYSVAAQMYKEVIRRVRAGDTLEDRHVPGKVVRGVQVHMMYVNKMHYIQVDGIAEKLPGVES